MAKFVFDDGTEFVFEYDDAPVLGGMIGVYGAALGAIATGDSSRLVKMIMQVEFTHSKNTSHLIKFGEQLLLKEAMARTGKTEEEIKQMFNEHQNSEKNTPASRVKALFEE